MPCYWDYIAERKKVVNKKLSDIKQGKIEPRQGNIEWRVVNKNDDPEVFKRLEQRQKELDIVDRHLKRLSNTHNE